MPTGGLVHDRAGFGAQNEVLWIPPKRTYPSKIGSIRIAERESFDPRRPSPARNSAQCAWSILDPCQIANPRNRTGAVLWPVSWAQPNVARPSKRIIDLAHFRCLSSSILAEKDVK